MKAITRIIGLYLNLLSLLAPRKAGKGGFELFCYPRRVSLSEKQLTFLKAAAHTRIEVEGVQLQLYRWGNGPKNILLIHGWQSHSYRWKTYIEAFDKKEFSVYAFDAPGHGLSTGNFLSVPLYEQAIDNVIKVVGTVECMVGHSIGSFSAVYHLFKNGQARNVNRMVAMASPGEVEEFFKHFKKVLRLSDTTMKVVFEHFEGRFQRLPNYFSAPSFAPSIEIPGLIIHDQDDKDTEAAHSRRLHQAWKNSRLMITQGTGHNLKSSDVLQEVLRFVQGADVGQQTSEVQIGNGVNP
jgi:pimeloyl-ACP methyl ester carboxylesterase